jgi:hypothetical protein
MKGGRADGRLPCLLRTSAYPTEVTRRVAEAASAAGGWRASRACGRGGRAYKNGQHVPRKEFAPCPSSQEGPGSEPTLPFFSIFVYHTRCSAQFLSAQ